MAQPRFRVDPAALAGSAAQVSAQGEELASAHLSSDNRVATAQSGWVGASAAALDAKAAAWLETTRDLLTRLGDHASDLAGDGIAFVALERDNIEKLRAAVSNPAATVTFIR
jgi:WXG100 family type VII secretion target